MDHIHTDCLTYRVVANFLVLTKDEWWLRDEYDAAEKCRGRHHPEYPAPLVKDEHGEDHHNHRAGEQDRGGVTQG